MTKLNDNTVQSQQTKYRTQPLPFQVEVNIPYCRIACSDMASWTPESNRYLSCLLDDVSGTEEMVAMRKYFCKIFDCMLSCNNINDNIYFTGSKAEGLDLPSCDEDYMLDKNNVLDIEVSESRYDLMQSTRTNKLLIITDNVPPGFVMLKAYNSLQNPTLRCSLVNMGENKFLSSQVYMSVSLNKSSHGNYLNLKRKIQGPSLESWFPFQDLSKDGNDLVHSIHCNVWPTSAKE